MASVPNGSFWEVRDDMDPAFQGQQSISPLLTYHAYSNEALVDGDEYFSDHMEYEEPTSQRRNRQRPLGASPVHRGQAEAEQRRHMGKSMPQLHEPVNGDPGRPHRQHQYEVIPQGPATKPAPPPPPAPLPPRPFKNQTPPRQSSGTPPKRTPSNASQIRRQGSVTRSTPVAVSAISHPKMAVFLKTSSVTPRRNLTPLMNSMSPQRHSDRRPPRPQHATHRRSLSMSSTNPKIKTTAIIAPSTYRSYDLEGLAYESPHRAQTELEADMAELHASLMASPSQCCRPAPKAIRKSMSPRMTAATSTSPLCMESISPASSKLRSWARLPGEEWAKKPIGAVGKLLVFTGVLLILCGLAAGGMCFYLLSQKGRTYYVDLGILASFTSVLLGAFGLRARATGRIPNRNYITAYILLTTFAILNVGGLVAIILAPPPTLIGLNAIVSGTPIVDIAAGAVCATSAMTLLVTAVGMFLAFCSHYPPPDNRVSSCSPGFRI